MANTLTQLVEKAHEFLTTYASFYSGQLHYNGQLIQEGLQKGGFHPEVRQKITSRDVSIENFPYELAQRLLQDVEYTPQHIQMMIDNVKKFTKYDAVSFEKYGSFLSQMMIGVAASDPQLTFDTHNHSRVHVPSFFRWKGRESSFLIGNVDHLNEHYRKNGLISRLAARLSSPMNVILRGNVGSFFAAENKGADVRLDGECGWRPCYGIISGEVTINGIAGYELAAGARGGKISVNEEIRSVGAYYTSAFDHELYLNGVMLPKENVHGVAGNA